MLSTKTKNNNKNNDNSINNDIKMSIFEHLEELRTRIIKSFLCFTITTCLSFIYIKDISYLLKQPAIGIKFLQLSPGEYFFTSIKVAMYTGLITSSPFIIYQITLFILPGLTVRETKLILPILITSILLFFIGILFSYSTLTPAALNFFINYGSDIVEPVWSFEQYFDFILTLLLSTGIAFQVPVIQIVVGIFEIISSTQMISAWKYIVLICTIIGAILTPSTDPFTQIILSFAILSLYFIATCILMILKK
uniref:Sec-independent translocase component C n=1 Tax=Sporolithon durum TaxID=48970 RepID=A0A141SCS2_9FLOR|nr:Sec-independent translocase component C [Sporolithon durum]AMK96090.1 Sec-independent translocase component C [Sporolithon durum]